MLVTSAVRRHKKSPPTCEKAAAVGVAPLPVEGNEDLSVSRLAAVLRGSNQKVWMKLSGKEMKKRLAQCMCTS